MQVHQNIPLNPISNAVVTMGTFDGLHFGHRKILNRLIEIAQNSGGQSVVITFFPHPRMVLQPNDGSLKLLQTIEEKIQELENIGIQHLVILPFTTEIAEMAYEDFVQNILVDKIGLSKMVIGYDHHFGKNRGGGLKELQALAPKYHFEVEEIPEQDINDIAVSSTKIRNALTNGDISTANRYLTKSYTLTGTVVEGDKIGRTIGFPTANLHLDQYKLIPADGIYAVHTHGAVEGYGMLYIGTRPVVDGSERRIEVNIFDFDKDIYNQELKLDILQYIRGDQHFDSLEAMQAQIKIDELEIRKIVSSQV